jgi:glutathione S-transferase
MTDRPTITALDWVPESARGLVRDLRVRWALEEVGQPYDVRHLVFGTQKDDPHRRRQPFGQVPTYEKDGLVLFESGAIVLHIAQQRAGLLPADENARARAIAWTFAALNTVEPPIMDLAFATVFERDESWSRPRIPGIQARIRERLGETAGQLGEADWLDGAFSAGDLMMISVLRMLRGSRLVEEHPNLAAYVARGEARSAFQRALAAQMAGFTGTAPPGFTSGESRGTPEKEHA